MAFLILIVGVVAGYSLYPVDKNNDASNGKVNSKKHYSANQGVEYDYSDLEQEIDGILGADAKNYSVYVYYPDASTPPLLMRPQVRRTASMIKVFIMAYAMERIKDGKLSFDDEMTITARDKVGGAGTILGRPNGSKIKIKELIERMITESDNTATNMLIEKLGMNNINDYLKREGYNETALRRKMMDRTLRFEEKQNVSSPKDLGTLFYKIYSGTCVNEEYDDIMLEILLGQTDKVCLPQALPGTRVAHKTGELNDLYDDGGIVFTGDVDFIIVVMDEGVGVGYARDYQQDIARAVYRHRVVVQKLLKKRYGNTWSGNK